MPWKWGLTPETIREFREKHGLSIEEAAFCFEVSPAAWGNFESHRSSPTNRFCVLLSQSLSGKDQTWKNQADYFRKESGRWAQGSVFLEEEAEEEGLCK